MKKIAITGGIGSGKSMIAAYLKEKGYSVFSCDVIYREITALPEYCKKIQREFCGVVENGVINRKRLADCIFADPDKRRRLNEIAHPMIMEKLQKDMQSVDDFVVFAEVPLLFEGNYEALFDEIIVVTRDLNERIFSVCQRDGITLSEARSRINSQVDYDNVSFLKNLNKENVHIVCNQGDIQELQNKVEKIVKRIRET